MASKVFQRVAVTSLVVVVMFCSLPSVSAAGEMEGREREVGEDFGLCSLMEKGFHAYCFSRRPPNRYCNVLGVLLKDLCHINPPCLMATMYSACLPKFLCKGHTLPYGACPEHFVCCYSFSQTANFASSTNATTTTSTKAAAAAAAVEEEEISAATTTHR